MRSFQVFVILVAMAATVGDAVAATITVRKDGSGDYSQIQPALDAAASGDTILIGPGEFTEVTPSYIPGYAWDVEVCAYVRVPDLTIIGAGAEQTFIGPSTYYGSNQTYSPKCVVWLEGGERFIRDVTIRNGYEGIHAIGGPIYVDNCELDNNGGNAITWLSDVSGGWFRNCQITAQFVASHGIVLHGSGSDILIENCVFDKAFNIVQGIQNISYIDCDLRNCYWGTTDAAEISDGIIDGADNPNLFISVLFEPFHGQPVSIENTSWGDLKSMFR